MKTAIMIGILLLCFTVSFAANIEVMLADKQSQGIPEYEMLSQYLSKVSDISISDLGAKVEWNDIIFAALPILVISFFLCFLVVHKELSKNKAIIYFVVFVCIISYSFYIHFTSHIWHKLSRNTYFSVEIKNSENGESHSKTARLTDFQVKDGRTIIHCETEDCRQYREIKQTEFLVLVAKDLPKVVVIKPGKDKALALAVSDKK